MAIQKQQFYEGAALHLLARTGLVTSIRYDSPFFVLNNQLNLLLKYSTKGRSPWGFTFTPSEQRALHEKMPAKSVVIGLICGADGVAALHFEMLLRIAPLRNTALRISCYRRHNGHYEVNGPDGTLNHKIAPANWGRLLDSEVIGQ